MSGLKAGDQFPADVTFKYVPWTTDDVKVCGIPTTLAASKDWADKKVVLVSVPGAFTPTCSANHVPPFAAGVKELRAKGVDVIAIIAPNDAYVMSAWGKVNGVRDDDVLFLGDTETQFAKQIGWIGAGDRNARFAAIIDQGVVKYAAKEEAPGVTVSGFDAVLGAL
ncbi:hypothetical protein FH972_021220 [Carpinus fangiana]|uniref:Glutaredoxin-dependent peroxiredoxin n=1 Tax=Carpinus fangiana TaxID=176857 RepID=A0A5N6KP33_9ROSI|nr:hypothetical protein FH972_021220 [Carpinus fangiana]